MTLNFPRLFAEEAPDALIAVAPTGKIVYWNSGAQATFGYQAEEALGQLLVTLTVPPDRLLEEEQILREPLDMGSGVFESLRRKKDGSLIHVDVSAKTVRGIQGEVVCILTSVKDVTLLKVQRDAKLIEARFGGLLESMPDAIVMFNASGHIVQVNRGAERLFAYQRSDLLGKPVEVLLPQRSRASHVESPAGYFAHPRTCPMGAGLESFGRRKDGTEFPVEICFGPLQTEQGTITIGAIRDVASRKRVEEPLQRVSCMTSEFLSSMSHELRTPLNALIGFSEVLIGEKVGPLNAKQKEYLTDMLGSGRHLLQLLNGVLDFGKVETGQITLNPELFLPEEVIAEVVAGLGPLAQQKRITICQEVPPDAGPVYLDKRRFKQVLDSLLSTALSFTGPDGRVAVTVSERDEDMIELKVHDTGSGSRPADVGRLFVDFQQMDTTVACACPGIVLGLGLTRKMVELQGGTVRVESQPGQGSTFTVRLPQRLPETKCA